MENNDPKTDFYYKLETVSKRVHEFVSLLGSKYDLKWINRKGETPSDSHHNNASLKRQVSFMDELNTYTNISGIKKMLTQIETKKEKYATMHRMSQKFSSDQRLKQLQSSLENQLKKSSTSRRNSNRESSLPFKSRSQRKKHINNKKGLWLSISNKPELVTLGINSAITKGISNFVIPKSGRLFQRKGSNPSIGSLYQHQEFLADMMAPLAEVNERNPDDLISSQVSGKSRKKKRKYNPSPTFFIKKEIINSENKQTCRFRELEKYKPNDRFCKMIEEKQRLLDGNDNPRDDNRSSRDKFPLVNLNPLQSGSDDMDNSKEEKKQRKSIKTNCSSIISSALNHTNKSKMPDTSSGFYSKMKRQRNSIEIISNTKELMRLEQSKELPPVATSTRNSVDMNDHLFSLMSTRVSQKKLNSKGPSGHEHGLSMPKIGRYNIQRLVIPTKSSLKLAKKLLKRNKHSG